MNALVLAAGYATRLRPLTDTVAKPLLPVGGRPMIDYIVDAISDVPDVRAIHVVTNSRFASAFEEWARGRDRVVVHDDGTTSNEDRLGAIGDLRFVSERAGLDADDLIVVAGDNLFDFSLRDEVDFWRSKGTASVVALHDVGDLELAKQYSIVELDDDGRIVSFVEKPEDPATTLVGTATYVFHREHVRLVETYLAEGNAPDQPGRFLAWLCPRAPVYGYVGDGAWLDIGDRGQLLEADNRLRRRQGLPERDEYVLD
ncbi:MAG TPA: nucleotidyltransferase family protein [Gaiellaceae bacterium]|nr:nucleotidyltransferase family protein [Gaiellaceae bacterium]